ncbi:MAG: cyclic nucleotide-binding domain-containing protein [Pseudomonadota bacterium]
MDKEALLKNVDLFSALKRKVIKSLAASCVERSFKEGDALVEQGDSGRGLYIIVSGKVKIVKETVSGDQLEIAILGPGEFFGEMAVLDDAPRSASVYALEETRCLLLTAWDFKATMKTHPEIALEILPVVVKRFRETNDKLLALSRI